MKGREEKTVVGDGACAFDCVYVYVYVYLLYCAGGIRDMFMILEVTTGGFHSSFP